MIEKFKLWLFMRWGIGGHLLPLSPDQCAHLFEHITNPNSIREDVRRGRIEYIYGIADLDFPKPEVNNFLDMIGDTFREERKGYDLAICHTFAFKFYHAEDMVQFKLTFL